MLKTISSAELTNERFYRVDHNFFFTKQIWSSADQLAMF